MQHMIDDLITELLKLDPRERINQINAIKQAMHRISPMKNEPVDCVIWVDKDKVIANDYNPNAVAPPEMDLLQLSISADGFTQPIVTFADNNIYTVIDGFHRNRVGKECKEITDRVKGYLPVTVIRADREDRSDRIAATIRHNRARGKHKIDAMSDIIIELKRRNWSDKKIGKELGMEPDEVLRLAQITGLRDAFKNKEFSKAWEPE
jgi:ParB-like chromosome segregation protein Spo0J